MWKSTRMVSGPPLHLSLKIGSAHYSVRGRSLSETCRSVGRSSLRRGGTVKRVATGARKEIPCAVGVQKGFLCSAVFTLSECDFCLPPFPVSHSSEGSGSSKDTLVDSRKSGCRRSIRNLVGVSKWVEPAEEQRWLHALNESHTAHCALSPPFKRGLNS